MDLKTAVVALIEGLNAEQIEYMLVGSFSTNYYGIPRSTKDADFVLQLPSDGLQRIRSRLRGQFEFDPQMTFESVTGTQCIRVRVPESSFILELFRLSRDPHDQSRFQRKQAVKYLDQSVILPTPEDVIVTKIRWAESQNRTKDREDAREVIAVQDSKLDWTYIYHWADEHRTRDLLDRLRQSVV